MASKKSSKSTRQTAAAKGKPRAKPAARQSSPFDGSRPGALGDLSKMAKLMTPEQAFDLYRANAKIALDVINAAVESTAKLRRLQFEGEEQARSMQKKAARHVAEAGDAQALVAAGQSVTQEAVEKAMHYWGQMFEMIVEIQKRLFALIEEQMRGVPGAQEAKAMMAMMPDLKQAQNLVNAMQGVMSSSGSAFSSMQRMMGDFARNAQQSAGGKR
jgi:phasin family protein